MSVLTQLSGISADERKRFIRATIKRPMPSALCALMSAVAAGLSPHGVEVSMRAYLDGTPSENVDPELPTWLCRLDRLRGVVAKANIDAALTASISSAHPEHETVLALCAIQSSFDAAELAEYISELTAE